MIATERNTPPLWALGLGYGGLVPFVTLASGVWLLAPVDGIRAVTALLSYSATILSFLGAIHWGLTMRGAPVACPAAVAAMTSRRTLVWGVIPSLIAWVALLLNPVSGLWLIAAGLWACLVVDHLAYPLHGVQAWLPMRRVLTVVASVSCVAGALGLAR